MKPLPFTADDKREMDALLAEVGMTPQSRKWLDNQPDEDIDLGVDPEGQMYVDAIFGDEDEIALKALILGLEDELEFKAVTITPGGRVGDDSSRNLSPKENWVDQRGGLPRYIRIVRNGLIRNGHSESRATALAVAAIKRWARGGNNVTAKVQAAAAKALAEWEAMKATKGLNDELPLEFKMRTMEERAEGQPTRSSVVHAASAGRSAGASVAKKPTNKPLGKKKATNRKPTNKPLGKGKGGGAGGQKPKQDNNKEFNEKHPRDQFGKFVAISRGDGIGKDRNKDAKKTQQIKDVQKALIAAGLLDKNSGDKGASGIDGAFGPKTEAAVKKWQKANGMKPDGLLSSEMVDRIVKSTPKGKAGAAGAAGKKKPLKAAKKGKKTTGKKAAVKRRVVAAKKTAVKKKAGAGKPATAGSNAGVSVGLGGVRKVVEERRRRFEDHQKRLENLLTELERNS